MLKNGVFGLFSKMALRIFHFSHVIIVEDNGARHLTQIAIFRKFIKGINEGIKNRLEIFLRFDKRICH